MSQLESAETFAPLYRHQFANLTTFRKNGTAVPTPVWFALEGGKIYVTTLMDAGKVKRIRNNSRVTLAPCTRSGDPLGPAVEAQARVLPPEQEAVAKRALDAKYGFQKLVFDFFLNVRGAKRAYIEIVPA
ncbi:MAG: PPOX class F420-dependent oxidoreductase [Chloroflexaceae bacterium]|jgi:hypothetical protein|nr:PPOX class F420-dependent oxidoreductase [Chloroflexaceae bacterium]